ncbi:MAG: amidohydrolase [Bacteroidota bacterium]
MQDLTITLVQTTLAWEDPDANISNFDTLMQNFDISTDLIILPEMFNTGFTMNARQNAELMEGKTMQWMTGMAKDKQCAVCGSLIINDAGGFYNRLIWMEADGSYQYYDKKHLFRMGDEHLHFHAGNKRLIVDLKGWKLMPLICYDLRFPVWSKNTYLDGKYAYDLLIYIANWPAIRSLAWTSLVKGRAIENMAYAAGVNRTGKDGRAYEYTGNSLLSDPGGKILTDAGSKPDAVITTQLKASKLTDIREKLGVGKDWDKFELY